MNKTQLISRIENSNEELAVMIGSGLSSAAGMPSWAALLNSIAPLVEAQPIGEDNELPAGFQNFYDYAENLACQLGGVNHATGQTQLKQNICDQISSGMTTANLDILAPLMNLDTSKVITFNYDDLFARIMKNANLEVKESVPPTAQRPNQSATEILYLHGRYDDPEHIVITRSDTDKIKLTKSALHAKAESWYRDYTVLHLGLGFEDMPMLDLLLSATNQPDVARTNHLAIVTPSVGEFVRNSQTQSNGIQFCVVERDEVLPLISELAQVRQKKKNDALIVDIEGKIETKTKPTRFEKFPLPKVAESIFDEGEIEDWLARLNNTAENHVLIGAAACGKTTLFQAVGHRIIGDKDRFKGGIIYVSDPSNNVHDVCEKIRDDLREQDFPVEAHELGSVLERLKPVLVLDNLSSSAFRHWKDEVATGVFSGVPCVALTQSTDVLVGTNFERHNFEAAGADKAIQVFKREHPNVVITGPDSHDELVDLLTNNIFLGGNRGAISIAAQFMQATAMSVASYRTRLMEAMSEAVKRNDHTQGDLMQNPTVTREHLEGLSEEQLKQVSYRAALDVAFNSRFSREGLSVEKSQYITSLLGEYADHNCDGTLSISHETFARDTENANNTPPHDVDYQDFRKVAVELNNIGLIQLKDEEYTIPHPIRIYAQQTIAAEQFKDTRRARLKYAMRSAHEKTTPERSEDLVEHAENLFEIEPGTTKIESLAAALLSQHKPVDLEPLARRVRDYFELEAPLDDPETLRDYATALNEYGNACYDAGQYHTGAAQHMKAADIFRRLGDVRHAVSAVSNWAYLAPDIELDDGKQLLARWADIAAISGDGPSASHLNAVLNGHEMAHPSWINRYYECYLKSDGLGGYVMSRFALELPLKTGSTGAQTTLNLDHFDAPKHDNRNFVIKTDQVLNLILDLDNCDPKNVDILANALYKTAGSTQRDTFVSAVFTLARVELRHAKTAQERKSLFNAFVDTLRAGPNDLEDQIECEITALVANEALVMGDFERALRAAEACAETIYGSRSRAKKHTFGRRILTRLLMTDDAQRLRDDAVEHVRDLRENFEYVEALELQAAIFFSEGNLVGLAAIRTFMKGRHFFTDFIDVLLSRGSKSSSTVTNPSLWTKQDIIGDLETMYPAAFEGLAQTITAGDGSTLSLEHTTGSLPQYISETPVTFAQFQSFREETEFPKPTLWKPEWPTPDMLEDAAIGLSRLDAIAYSSWYGMYLPRAEKTSETPDVVAPADEDLTALLVKVLKFSTAVDVNVQEFSELLAASVSLSANEKVAVIEAAPTLSQFQIDQLTLVFTEEREKFAMLAVDHPEDIKKLLSKTRAEFVALIGRYGDVKPAAPKYFHSSNVKSNRGVEFESGLRIAICSQPTGLPQTERPNRTAWQRNLIDNLGRMASSEDREIYLWLVKAHNDLTGRNADILIRTALSPQLRPFENDKITFENPPFEDLDTSLADVADELGLEKNALQFNDTSELSTVFSRVLMGECDDKDIRERAYMLLCLKQRSINPPQFD